MEEKKKPTKYRKGNIVLNEWLNNKDGVEYKSYSIQRIYKDKDDKWNSSESFTMQDLSMLRDSINEFFALVKPLKLEEINQ